MESAKILLVDDEPDIIEILSYNLRSEGYEIKTAYDGAEGLKVAADFMPDLIILDIMMPEMDGVEMCRQLRSQKVFDETLIAFLTAREEDYSQISGFEAGADDYITKPLKPRVLKSRVKALLRRSPKLTQGGQKVLEFGNIRIDLEKMVVFNNNVQIEFPRKEFELLILLSGKPGRVFTRSEIFQLVWGSDVIVGERTIDVYIRKLREKLGNDIIKTVKGVGYRFDF